MRAALLTTFTMFVAAAAAAQTAPPVAAKSEHFGIGGFGAVGTAALGAIRLSAPLGAKAGLDVDIGRTHTREDRNAAVGAQVRWLWRGRGTGGNSGYFIFGALRLQETRRYWASAGRGRWEVVEHRSPTMPQFGYGWDWLAPSGTRLGLELTTGSEGEAGPRAFAKVFLVWGPSLRQ